MGGPGSGRIRDFSSQPTVEDVNRISIYEMRKQGLLEPGTAGELTWSLGDRIVGFVAFHVSYDDQIILHYGYHKDDGTLEPVEQNIQIVWSKCNLGGKRPWFKCPGCEWRSAVLCDYGERFLCRRCYELPYASQQRGYTDRMMEQARKIRRRIGVTENLWPPLQQSCKPKGMHWKTFYRLVEREAGYNLASLSTSILVQRDAIMESLDDNFK